MDIVVESYTTATDANVTEIAFNKPSGVQNGDVLVASFMTAHNASESFTAPSDWVVIKQQFYQNNWTAGHQYYKVIANAAGEPSSYTWSWTTSVGNVQGGIARCSGVDNITPIDVAASAGTGASTTPTAPGITTQSDNALLIWAASSQLNPLGITQPSGFTEEWETQLNEFSYYVQATAGDTGSQQGTFGTSRSWVAILSALRPASVLHKQTVAVQTAGSATVTYTNLAVGSGVDRTLVAYVSIDDAGSTTTHIDSVVFNTSESFTYRAVADNEVAGANTVRVEIWTLDNPSNTTANVVATASEAASGLSIIISEYWGANNGVGASVGSATGLGTNPSCTFSTGSARSLICGGAIVHQNSDLAFTPGTGTTERYEGYNGTASLNYVAGEEVATGGSDTIDWTIGTTSYWAICAIELLAAAEAAGNPWQVYAQQQ